MFIFIILNCGPRDPVSLLGKHWEALTDDTPPYFQRKLGMQTWPDDQRKSLGLEFLLREYITINGSATEFPLPQPTTTFLADRESAANGLLYEETHYDVERINGFLSGLDAMNTDQSRDFQEIDEALRLADTVHAAALGRYQTLFFLARLWPHGGFPKET
jgi:hypothetical protein